MHYIKTLTLTLTLSLSFLSVASVATTYAMPLNNTYVAEDLTSDAQGGVSAAGGGGGTGKSVPDIVNTVAYILSTIVGMAAVIMVIISGFKYITSGGDTNKVGSAKNSLIYAIVGLVIVSLVQFIVHFVIYRTSN